MLLHAFVQCFGSISEYQLCTLFNIYLYIMCALYRQFAGQFVHTLSLYRTHFMSIPVHLLLLPFKQLHPFNLILLAPPPLVKQRIFVWSVLFLSNI